MRSLGSSIKNLKVAFKKKVGKSQEHIFCMLKDYLVRPLMQ